MIDDNDKLDEYQELMVRDGTFNKITKMAADVLGVPIVVVNVVDRDQTCFISHYGVEDGDMLRDPSAFAASHGLKYTGVPLSSRNGEPVGIVCVFDRSGKDLTREKQKFLRDIAELISDEIEMRGSVKRVLSVESRLLRDAVEAKEKAEYVANHDALTGLANRLYFMRVLEETVNNVYYVGASPAVYMLDLDKFKHANDTHGHQFGDSVLREVAKRIKSCVGERDVTARLGGDEFVILKRETDRDAARALAGDLVSRLADPYVFDDKRADLSSSVGFSLLTSPRDNARQMIRNADLALYRAKSQGGRNFQEFDNSIDQNTETRHRA